MGLQAGFEAMVQGYRPHGIRWASYRKEGVHKVLPLVSGWHSVPPKANPKIRHDKLMQTALEVHQRPLRSGGSRPHPALLHRKGEWDVSTRFRDLQAEPTGSIPKPKPIFIQVPSYYLLPKLIFFGKEPSLGTWHCHNSALNI